MHYNLKVFKLYITNLNTFANLLETVHLCNSCECVIFNSDRNSVENIRKAKD